MKAICVQDEALVWQETETPIPEQGEVRIKVAASSVNRADLLQRRGLYPPPQGASSIIGLECAGEIEMLGDGVERWQIGDKVCALLAGGGYAETVCVDAGSVVSVPSGLSFNEAAALPEVFATAWLNLFVEAKLTAGEKALIHAGASGVGTAAIQLCKVMGNPCFVTVGSEEKIARCIELGANAGSNRHDGPFLEAAKAFAGEQGIAAILDPVGGQYLKDNISLLGIEGRLVIIGLMGGAKAEIALGLLLAKRLRVIGSTLRTRSNSAKQAVMEELEALVWPKIASGEIKPIIEKTFKMQDADAAQSLVAGNETFGKVVLEL